ncbi:MAG TPA: kelch repeat-containing protein [Actinomycetota bacterium]|nr:kelch repeat-containing protein [Actinomycetota bacterium]
MPNAPAGSYNPEGAFWTGERFLVVAGATVETWNPNRNEWKVVAQIPQADDCEGCGYGETAVWTGEELLLWGGGFSFRAPNGSKHKGVSVDLEGEVVPLPDAPIPVRRWHQAVWTGSEMITFGGGSDSVARNDGAAYNPGTRTWREIARSPVGGYVNTLVWTGKEMITWGGIEDATTSTHGYPSGFIAQGAAYDPAADEWRRLAGSGLDPRGGHSAVWTGEEMIVWGGLSRIPTTCHDCGYPTDAGAYNPSTDKWRAIRLGPMSGRVDHTSVWTGQEMIVYGGSTPGGSRRRNSAGLYDLAADRWRKLPEPPIAGRNFHVAVWTGTEMLVWGGQKPNGQPFSDGVLFVPDW